MAKVVTDDKHYKAIADAIREFNEGTPDDVFRPSDMASGVRSVAGVQHGKGMAEGADIAYGEGFQDGYDDGFTVGEQSEYDRFWDGFQADGTRNAYGYAFSRWPDEIYDPKYPISATTSCSNIYQWSTIKDTRKDIIIIGADVTALFDRCTELVTVRKIVLQASTGFTNWFRSCGKLVDLTIDGTIDKTGLDLQYSKSLSKASITSVVNALSTTTSGLSVTLSKTAVNEAFTDAEWSTLAGMKSNWTINLV